MHEFGTTPEQLAEVAVAERYGATLHPLSFQGHRGELTIEDVVNSKMVADPLHMLDCCAINQGGGAVLVTTAANVRALGRHAPVGLLGYGEGHSHVDPNALPSLAEPLAGAVGAETAFAAAGISREDIDVCTVSDHFTIGVIFALEAAGFCAPGEGGSFVEDGALRIGGRLPTNTSGGFLSFSHAGNCGVFQLTELVAQLRGAAGPRQVPGAAFGYAGAIGGAMQSNASAILGRL
jgi:acetyl-CoA acetyltransferase